MSWRTRLLVSLSALALAGGGGPVIVAATNARAASLDAPALDQYVPSLPSASAGHSPSAGGGTLAAAHVSPAVLARLARQSDGALLSRIAASPGLGAPPHVAASRAVTTVAPQGSVGSALAGAMSNGAIVALAIGLVALGGSGAGLALVRRRAPRRRTEH
jgi:hypothetical protein